MAMRVQQVCCVHREKGTAYVVPVPARSYAEAAAKAAAAGHVVAADGGSAADASSVGSPLQDGQGADDRQRRTEALLHEIAGHLAALREGQSRLVARTHWPSAVTALLALALAALLLPSAFGGPATTGAYLYLAVIVAPTWILIAGVVALAERWRRR